VTGEPQAHTYDITVQMHTCGSPVTMACALAVETAIPNFLIHEHVSNSGAKENLELVTPDLSPVKGYLTVPEGPGLGIELNERVIAQYSYVRVG